MFLFDIFSPSPQQHVSGKVVMVTGASSGIGRQLATDFFKYGARVILASRSTEQLENLRQEEKVYSFKSLNN